MSFSSRLSSLLVTVGVAAGGQTFWPESTVPGTPSVTTDRASVTLDSGLFGGSRNGHGGSFLQGQTKQGHASGAVVVRHRNETRRSDLRGGDGLRMAAGELLAPVPIAANTNYVIAYLAPGGAYAVDDFYPWSAVGASPLHVSGLIPGRADLCDGKQLSGHSNEQ